LGISEGGQWLEDRGQGAWEGGFKPDFKMFKLPHIIRYYSQLSKEIGGKQLRREMRGKIRNRNEEIHYRPTALKSEVIVN
jgi:hypothetical protein